jgi:hypothetical protein
MKPTVFRFFRPGARCRLGLLLASALAAGCGAGQVTVSGRVLCDGTPLPGGRVTFRPADPKQNAVSAEIDRQGNYEAVLPAGDVQVCVDNQEFAPRPAGGGVPTDLPPELRDKVPGLKSANPAPPAAPPPASDRYRPIPGRYAQVETSGLHFTARPGMAKQDIELTTP